MSKLLLLAQNSDSVEALTTDTILTGIIVHSYLLKIPEILQYR